MKIVSLNMKAVLCCAKADGVLSPEEKNWAIGFCASWGVADWIIEELKTYEADEAIEEVIARSPQVSMAQRKPIIKYLLNFCLTVLTVLAFRFQV